MVEGQAVEPLQGDGVLNQSSMMYSASALPLDGAQQYTMKSMTLNNMNVENSSENETQFKENKSDIASPSIAIGLYYQGGAVLQLLPSAQNSQMVGASKEQPINAYGQLGAAELARLQNVRAVSKTSSGTGRILDVSNGNLYTQMGGQNQAHDQLLRSQSQHDAQNSIYHYKQGRFGGNISPVSHHSFIQTENDNKISFGSYAPSHISSLGGVGQQSGIMNRGLIQ